MISSEAMVALAPVRSALLAEARDYAAAVRAEADEHARGTLATAAAEAERVVAEARQQGRADAAEVLVGQQARGRRDARALVLRAQRAAYDDLRREARDLAGRLAAARPELADVLAAAARDRLGPDATVAHRHDGAVVATRGAQQWVWSPATVADSAVDGLGAEVEKLWAP